MSSRLPNPPRVDILWGAAAVCAPFLILYWLVPWWSTLTIGNDYVVFPIQQQMELAFSRAMGSFPLYAPGFAVGRSAAALTLGQAYHPLAYAAAAFPQYWEGGALDVNTLLRLLSLGAAHLALFALLRRLSLSPLIAFALSAATVYHQRMLDLFRYGASLENETGYLFLCAALGFHAVARAKRLSFAFLIAATYWLVTGGHPQMMYLGLLGAALAVLWVPWIAWTAADEMPHQPWRAALRYYLEVGAAVGLGIALALPYILPFYAEFVKENALRVGRDYTWALAYNDTLGGAVANLFDPLNADVHGAFGATALPLLALAAPVALAAWVRIPWFVLGAWATTVLVGLTVLGADTPVHFWFWKYFPLAQTFRTPGRNSMMLAFLFLLLAVWLFSDAPKRPLFGDRAPRVPALLAAACGAVGAWLLYAFWLRDLLPGPSTYHPATIIGLKMRDPDLLAWLESTARPWSARLVLAGALAAAVWSLLRSPRVRWLRTAAAAVFATAILAGATLTLRCGTWITERRPTPTWETMREQKRARWDFFGAPGFGMEAAAVTEHMERAPLSPRLAVFYPQAVAVDSRDAAYAAMLRRRTSTNAFVEAPERLLPRGAKSWNAHIELTHATFNQLRFDVTSDAPGVVAISAPFDGRWRAQIDGRDAPVYRVNGLETGVVVSKGAHTVRFYYHSAATVLGVVLAALVAAGLLLWWAWTVRPRRRAAILGATGLALIAAACTSWWHGLYTGENLETRYAWSPKDLSPPDNAAFGKRARMSSIASFQMPYFYYAGLAVDGVRTGRASRTRPAPNSWWQVDLGRPIPLGHVDVYGHIGNGAGVAVLISPDGRRFRAASPRITRVGSAIRFVFAGQRARVVRLQLRRPAALALTEVEVYPFTQPKWDDHSDPTGNLRFEYYGRVTVPAQDR